MSEALVWTIPVIKRPENAKKDLRLTVENGEVLMVPPGPCTIPPSSVPQLCEALETADRVARGMGQGLT